MKKDATPTSALGLGIQDSPAFFVQDLMGLITMFQVKARVAGQLEFSDLQKAQIAGTLLMMGPAVQAFIDQLKKWGMVA